MKKSKSWLKKEGLVYSVLARNAYQTRTPHVRSTGFRMAPLHYSERQQLDNLAETFLVNSFLKRNDPEIETSISSYLTDDGIKMVSLSGQEDLSAYHLVELDEGAPLDCVFLSKRTTIPVYKRTLIPTTSEHRLLSIRTSYPVHIGIIC